MAFPDAPVKKTDQKFIHSSLGFSYLTVYRDPDGNFIELIGPMKE